MKNAQLTYLFQDTSKPHSINTNILPRHAQNIHHIRGIHPFMAQKRNLMDDETSSPALSNKDVNKLQQLTGTLLYYARAFDPTLIMPMNVLASEQSNATTVTADKVIKLLNYCNTHPETKIRYHASDMILHIHSDASYLSENEAKSRAGGFFTWAATPKPTKNSQTARF
jgi:hypothetical protein